MDETVKPATLPESCRKQALQTLTVGSLVIGQSGTIDEKAIAVDRDWGVWINPLAPVTPTTQRPETRITVTRLKEGYVVYCTPGHHTFDNSPANTSFEGAGFEPVVRVFL